MPTVLDSFIIEIGLDPAQLTQGTRDALDVIRKTNEAALQQANEVESHTKKMFDLMSSFRREAVTVLSLFFGGREIKDFVQHITNLDAATGRLATTLGMSAEETSAWQGAVKQAGGTAEGANSALAGLSGEMQRFMLTGESSMLPVLTRLGVGLYDQNRNLKTAGQLWLELSAAVQGMNAREATAFLSMIPGATQDMINFALMGPEAMQRYIAAAREAGVTTAQSAAEARAYQKASEQLDQSLTNLGRSIVTTVAPALVTLANALARLLQSWNTPAGSPQDKAQSAAQREQLIDRFGSPADLMRYIATHNLGGGQHSGGAWGIDAWLLRKADEWYGAPGTDQKDIAATSAAAAVAEKLKGMSANTGDANWDKFLQGLSYLETSHRDVGNATSSAQGYFQFTEATARDARAAGLQDPRIGSYQDQAGATKVFIEHFHPAAAAAIEAGDYERAIPMLRGRWPSLPGGSQPQAGYRYSNFGAYLAGQGGQSSAGGKSVKIDIGEINIHTPRTDGEGLASEVDGALRRSLDAGAANYGQQ